MVRKRIRGFLLKHRVTTLFRRLFRRNCSQSAYRRLDPPRCNRVKPFSKLASWTRCLRTKAKEILSKNYNNSCRGFIRVGQEPFIEKPAPVPKGHMAVYVGQKDGGDFQRIFVPVAFFNHPLFGDLLKESEKEYGFNYPGGITIPCRISEFERIQTRIKSGQSTRKLR
ncbi:hypothetical protein ABFX02_02G149300 [Erythranthe guttata]